MMKYLYRGIKQTHIDIHTPARVEQKVALTEAVKVALPFTLTASVSKGREVQGKGGPEKPRETSKCRGHWCRYSR